jgi:hypothetical protein
MTPHSTCKGSLYSWIRWGSLLWLLIWFPVYWHTWGPANFLRLCNVAVILTCAGLLVDNPLLISSQAVSSLMVDTAWVLDVCCRVFTGRHLIGGTEYFFDVRFPLWIRLLSLYHLILPAVLLWALHRMGYDRRGWILQSAIALLVFVLSRFIDTKENLNFAFSDPFFHRTWGPAPVHIAISLLFLIVVAYIPTHALLKRLFPSASRALRSHASD